MKRIYYFIAIIISLPAMISCSSDEPVQKDEEPWQEAEYPEQEPYVFESGVEGDLVLPFKFKYKGINFNIEGQYRLNYFGEIPAEGGSFSISHEYNFYFSKSNNMYSMLTLFINDEYIKGNRGGYNNSFVPADGIEYCGDWGSIVTRFEDHNTITTFSFEKNETGIPRNIDISLGFWSNYADIYLTQESL